MVNQYGIVDYDYTTKLVKQFIEKPKIDEAPSDLSVIGKYIINKDIIDILKEGVKSTTSDGEIRLADAIIKALTNKKKVN